jgi:hypothetical protein
MSIWHDGIFYTVANAIYDGEEIILECIGESGDRRNFKLSKLEGKNIVPF